MTIQVKNVQMHRNKVVGYDEYNTPLDTKGNIVKEFPVVEAKFMLIDAPAGGHPQMIATGRLINNVPSAQIPILVSETEKIDGGDWYLFKNNNTICQAETELKTLEGLREIGAVAKIIALPEDFSAKQLEAIIKGKINNGDKVLVECEYYENPAFKAGLKHGDGHYIKLSVTSHITLHKQVRDVYGDMRRLGLTSDQSCEVSDYIQKHFNSK